MRKQFYDYHRAITYQRYLKGKGLEATIHEAYNWQEQRTVYTVMVS